MLTQDEKDYIIDWAKSDYECGTIPYDDPAEYDAIYDIMVGEFGEDKAKEGTDFYFDLVRLGPAGMLEEYPELNWDSDFVAEYSYDEDTGNVGEDFEYTSDSDDNADWYKKSKADQIKMTEDYLNNESEKVISRKEADQLLNEVLKKNNIKIV